MTDGSLMDGWRLRVETDDEPAEMRLSDQLDIHPATARLLVQRGIIEVEKAAAFLHPRLENLHDPFKLPDLKPAVARLKQAEAAQERVLVFGDYDADGMSATAILVQALSSKMGERVDYRIPDRIDDGYGIKPQHMDQAAADGYALVITVDNGISALPAVERAAELGLDLIVTDHHEPPGESYWGTRRVPAVKGMGAIPAIDPKRPDSEYPFRDLTGAGLALKVAQAYLGEEGTAFLRQQLDTAAIGTLADAVPLRGENRIIVRLGIQRMLNDPQPGIAVLLEQAKLSGRLTLTTRSLSFGVIPTLNAAGRVGDPEEAVKLLLSSSRKAARHWARRLKAVNEQRRALQQKVTAEAVEMVSGIRPRPPVFVAGSPGWHPGVIGIAAARLVDRFQRAAVLIAVDEETGLGRGSARAPEAQDIWTPLSRCQPLLETFGGHKQAAGFTLKASHIPRLRKQLVREIETGSPEVVTQAKRCDGRLPLRAVSRQLVDEIEQLRPFGPGNPEPLWLCAPITFAAVEVVGSKNRHLKGRIDDASGTAWNAIAFGKGERVNEIDKDQHYSIAYRPYVNRWQGRERLELQLEGFQPVKADDSTTDRRSGQRLIQLVRDMSPERSELAAVYVALRRFYKQGDALVQANDTWAERIGGMIGEEVTPQRLKACLDIFVDMDLSGRMQQGDKNVWVLRPAPDESLDLDQSPRFQAAQSRRQRLRTILDRTNTSSESLPPPLREQIEALLASVDGH